MRSFTVGSFIQRTVVIILASLSWPALAAEWPAVKLLPAALSGAEPSPWPALAAVEGEPAALYSAADGNRVTFRRGDQVQTLDEQAPAPGGKFFQLHQVGRQTYALWWNRLANGTKWLYLRASPDGGKTFGPLAVLNSNGGVLADYQLAADDAGKVAVIFQDERAGYGVYLNRSTDGGKTWLEKDIRLDAPMTTAAEPQTPAAEAATTDPAATKPAPEAATADPSATTPAAEAATTDPAAAQPETEPTAAPPPAAPKPPRWSALAPKLIYQQGQWLAVWQQFDMTDDKTVARWLARTSTDGGQNWGPPVEIETLPQQQGMTEMVLLAHRDQVYVVGFVPEQGLLAFRSADMGRRWAPLGVLPVSGPDETMSYLRAVVSGDNVLVSYTLQSERHKFQVYVATLATATGAWQSPPWRLDRGKDRDYAKASFVELATLPNGAVIAVWEDFRPLLPGVYLDYSADGGKTWLAAPQPLTEPGRLVAMNPRLLVSASEVVVIFDQWRTAARLRRDAAYLTLPYRPDSGLALAEFPAVKVMPLAESLQRIRQRAEEFWTLRTQGKFAETWDYFDPVYRARVGSKDIFVQSQTQGRLAFIAFKLGEPVVDGVFGRIPVDLTYTAPFQVIGGEMPLESPPPREVSFSQEWLWFYDDWYMVPPPTMGPSHLDF